MNIDDTILYGGASRPLGSLILQVRNDHGELLDPFEAGVFSNPSLAREVSHQNGHQDPLSASIGQNLVVNLGRQAIANLIGARDVLDGPSPWAVKKVSWGRYDEAARFTDSTLSPQPTGIVAGGGNSIAYNGSDHLKPIARVDFPQAFIVRFECTLASGEANGQLLREMGLWTDNGTLFARKTMVGVLKHPGQALSWLWSLRS